MKVRLAQAEAKCIELQEQISSFNTANTMARKVEKDRQVYLDQLIKKKASTSPEDSKHYIHISKFYTLKDQLIQVKSSSSKMMKEVQEIKNINTNLRIINVKMQEAMKKLVKQNRDTPEFSKRVIHSIQKRKNKSISTSRQPSPIQSSEISNFFINRQMDKLSNHVRNIDPEKLLYDSNLQKEMVSLNIKRMSLIRKIKHGSSPNNQISIDSDYSQEFSHKEMRETPKNQSKLSKTVKVSSKDKYMSPDGSTSEQIHPIFKISKLSSSPPKRILKHK